MAQRNPSLAGQLLIAMPALADPNFWRTVVLVGVHSGEEGAFGLVINRPLDVDLGAILDELGEDRPQGEVPRVLGGGPVEPTHGFVLYEDANPEDDDAILRIGDQITVSGSTATLAALAHGTIRCRYFLLLGYSGWAPGQLEREIEENSWLVAPASSEIVFDTPIEHRWNAALSSIGVDPGTLVDLGPSDPS